MIDLFSSLRTALADTYQLERELGRGGMATVYLARELKHPRHVAIKVLRPELAGVMTRGRFLREINIASKLAHPNILPLLDSGTVPPTGGSPELPYYTMPYVEGETLRDRLRREQQLPIDDALRIADEVAAALGHAHAHDIVHRDIKPENILFMGGQAVVADFGIARAIKEAVDPDTVTSAGLVIGTPAYMSPEQAAGKGDLDGRSDIYSLGCVVYEMLGGEPPFTGATPQAVLARHRMDNAPSLRTLRTTVPDSVEQAVKRALEKSPADRFATAGQFAEALHERHFGETTVAAAPPRRLLLIGLAVVLLAFLASRVAESRSFVGDPNKVVVFPLGETPAGVSPGGTGAMVALMIGTALEYTEPLQWIDGQPLLDAQQGGDVGLLTAAEAGRIARNTGARWYLDGMVVRKADSATVVLRLNDARGDSVVGRASASRLASEAAQAGLAAVIQLLPRLLSPGQRMADLSALSDRRPAAVALWLQGEREYRRSNFPAALDFQRRAIAEDSALAVASIRGAQAASWMNDLSTARALSGLALRRTALLPGRMAPFARGLHAYVSGQADSAVHWLTQALQASPEWTEAHMALGEVYHHLLPIAPAPLDSLASREFAAAARDIGFAPPHFHLAEMAIRGHHLETAKGEVQTFNQSTSGGEEARELELMLSCLEHGRDKVDWHDAIGGSPLLVLGSAKMLSVAGAFPGCAEDGSRALRASTADAPLAWGAFVMLGNLLAASGRDTAITALVDSMRAAGRWQATTIYLINALAGVPRFESRAAEAVDALAEAYGPQFEDSLDNGRLLLVGTWHAQAGRAADASRLHQHLQRRAAESSDPEAALFAKALGAHILLAKGDSSAALLALQHLEPTAERDLLAWGYTESLPVERLTLARLLLERKRYEESLNVASAFDHPTPIVYLAFLPASLVSRYHAARALGQPQRAAEFRDRLVALGRADLIPAKQ